ncbi:MAG: STAS domain-containing protein, partial [Stellaceae bacterium]
MISPMVSAAATLAETEVDGSVVLAATGDWLVGSAAALDRRLRGLRIPAGRAVSIDLAAVDRIDTAGAWLLLRTARDLSARGGTVELRNLRPSFAPLLDQVRAGGMRAPVPHPRPAHHSLIGFVARIGEVSLGLVARARGIVGFLGLVVETALR